MTPAAALAAAMAAHLPAGTPRLGLAVSGGGDSLAMLALAWDWAAQTGAELLVATVDHGLRAEAAAEAAGVAALCRAWGIAHATLTGQAATPGNLQAAAREARYRCLSDWAAAHRISHVALAHTRDDQAETVLMRLARGSGVDGLAGMAAARQDPGGLVWLRPLLGVTRAALRQELSARGLSWVEDPSNTDPRFDRVRARALLADPPLPGLTVDTLAETATRMAAARTVLGQVAAEAADRCLTVVCGAVRLDRGAFEALAPETAWRLAAAALCRIGGQVYRPRLQSLTAALEAAAAGGTATLHGCQVSGTAEALWIEREAAPLAGIQTPAPGPWDSRWQVAGPAEPGLCLGALGAEGLRARPDWRTAGLRRQALLTTPGVWRGEILVAAPVLDAARGCPGAWHAEPLWREPELRRDLLSD